MDVAELKNCGTGAGGFQEGNTCARGGDSAEERLDAIQPATNDLHFGGKQGAEISMSDLGFSSRRAFGFPPPSGTDAEKIVETELLPSQIRTGQSTVTVEGVRAKLRGDVPVLHPAGQLPFVVKHGNVYSLQVGNHRAAADALNRGKVRVQLIEAENLPEFSWDKVTWKSPEIKSLKAADDTALERFEEFLERAVEDDIITSAEATDFRARWGTGNITAANVPLQLTEAIPEAVTPEMVLARVTKLGDRVLLAGRPIRAAKRDALQTAFEDSVIRLARGGAQVAEWHEGFVTALSEYMLDEALVGLGEAATTTMTAAQLTSITEVIREQAAYLSRFADQRAAYAFRDELMSWEYVAARSTLYSGRGRALWFQADEEADGRTDTVVFYEAIGDRDTCKPCMDAEAGSPYLPAEGPMPGDVCDGHGFCRCVRRTVEDKELAALLRGEAPAQEEEEPAAVEDTEE